VNSKFQLPKPDPDRFSDRITSLRETLLQSDPYILQIRTATSYEEVSKNEGQFKLKYWGKEFLLSFPGLQAFYEKGSKEASIMDLAMLLYYFNIADGIPLSNHWISFSELQDGKFYNQAFQSYTGERLVHSFSNFPKEFERAAKNCSGARLTHGDISFEFQILPRVNMLVVYWQGDEDFPSNFQILFDATSNHYLPTEAYAILGSTLTRKLISQI